MLEGECGLSESVATEGRGVIAACEHQVGRRRESPTTMKRPLLPAAFAPGSAGCFPPDELSVGLYSQRWARVCWIL